MPSFLASDTSSTQRSRYVANPSKQKGTHFEVSLLPALRRLDSRTDRSALKGNKDAGDFTALHLEPAVRWVDHPEDQPIKRLVVSAKNCKAATLSAWLKEVEQQRINAAADAGIVVHKKRGTTNPEEQYCTMSLGTLLRLLS